MSYTAKPQFTGGNSQSQSGQQSKPHGDIPPLQAYPQSVPGQNVPPTANANVGANHPLPQSGSVTMTPMYVVFNLVCVV